MPKTNNLQYRISPLVRTARQPTGAATWRTRPNNGVFDSAPLAQLCESVTSSTKPEVRNILQCRNSRPRVTCTENFVKFENTVFEIMRADIHTDRQTDRQTF